VNNTTLYLYRVNEEGARQLWALEVDGQKTIVSETRVEKQERSGLQDLGVTYSTDEQGRRTISNVDDRTKQALSFFTDAPCWFEGCEELRARYQEERAEQESETGCRTCVGSLYRKYMRKVMDAMPDQ